MSIVLTPQSRFLSSELNVDFRVQKNCLEGFRNVQRQNFDVNILTVKEKAKVFL